MFAKITLFKFALVPLAAVTLLAQVVSASPAADIQLRADDDPHFFWPPESCRTGIETLPDIIQPDTNAAWRVRQVQEVKW